LGLSYPKFGKAFFPKVHPLFLPPFFSLMKEREVKEDQGDDRYIFWVLGLLKTDLR